MVSRSERISSWEHSMWTRMKIQCNKSNTCVRQLWVSNAMNISKKLGSNWEAISNTRIKPRGNLKQREDQNERNEDDVWRQSQTTWTSNWEERGSRVKTIIMKKQSNWKRTWLFNMFLLLFHAGICVMPISNNLAPVYVNCVFEMPCNICNSKTSGRECNFGHSSYQLLRWTLLLINCSDQHCS